MLDFSLGKLRALTAAGALLASTATASAQYDGCASCGTPLMAPPIQAMSNPCCAPVICPPPVCAQPITETVYREVPVTKYRSVEKTVQKPVLRTVMEEREVTAYRTVNETRTAEVAGVNYQQVTECRPTTVNRSYWRTSYQPTCKMSPCQYDPRPTMAGELNRLGYGMRMAFTPNYIPRREFVPNVVAYNVPTTRTVAIPTSRTVSYNVARLEPYKTTQTVAVQKVEYVDTTVTAYEPYTEMQTVAVGTQTRYAFTEPFGSVTAARPTPSTTAEAETVRSRSAAKDGGEVKEAERDATAKPLSYPRRKVEESVTDPKVLQKKPIRESAPARTAFTPTSGTSGTRVAGWRPSRQAQSATAAPISVAAN